MGCLDGLFGSTKSNKVSPAPPPEPPRGSSAPSSLQVKEEEERWKDDACTRRLSDPDTPQKPHQPKAQPAAEATPPPKPQESAANQKQAPEASPGLAQMLPQAVTIPEHAQAWLQVLPEHVVRGLYAADWKDREQAVTGCSKILTVAAQSKMEAEPAFNVSCEVLKHTLKEKVVPMYFVSLDLLNAVLRAFVGVSQTSSKPASAVPSERLRKGVSSLVPILVHRYSNLNPRIQDTSLQALLSITASPLLGPSLITPHALPSPSSSASKGADSEGPTPQVKLPARLGLMAELLHHLSNLSSTAAAAAVEQEAPQQDGSGGSGAGTEELRRVGMPEEAVLQACREGLDSPEGPARMHGVRTLAELHRFKRVRGGQASQEQSSPEQEGPVLGPGLEAETCVGAIKPALATLLARRFAEVDAELSGTSVPASSLSVEGGSLRAPGLPSSLTPQGSAGSMRGKSQLPPLVGSGRTSRGSHPSSPAAPMRTHTPLATRPERPSPLRAGSSPKTSAPATPVQARAPSHSPIPDSMLNEDDEQMINDLMEQ